MGKDRLGGGPSEGDLANRPFSLYGRRLGRPLRAARRDALAALLPELQVELPASGSLDPQSLFGGKAAEIWLEIGAGNGEHAVWQAAHNPGIGLIAVEPFINGMSNLLATVHEQGFGNIRVVAGDARPLLLRLAPGSIARTFILFPDPWPKRRHWRRRIVNADVLDQLARLMPPGSELRMATDHPDYLVWILRTVRSHPRFEWLPANADAWRKRPADWIETRFEAKALAAGRQPAYLTFWRRDEPDTC